MNLTDRPLVRLFTLCILYVAQGIPYGFVVYTIAAYLSEEGLTPGNVGWFTGMATLPWTFKFLWGPIIDRFGIPSMGRRRPWILLAQFGMILTVLVMAVIPEIATNWVLLGWVVFVHNVFQSLQDVSVDALAVDLLREEERGRVSGLMYAFKYLGTFVGATVMSLIMSKGGIGLAFAWQAVILVLIFCFPLLLTERRGERLLPWTRGSVQLLPQEELAKSTPLLFRRLLKAFSLRSTLFAAVIGLVMFISSGALTPLTQALYIQDMGWSRLQYTNISGIAIWLGFAGAMAGGFIADLIGARKLIAISSIVLGLSYGTFAILLPGILGAEDPWFDMARNQFGQHMLGDMAVGLPVFTEVAQLDPVVIGYMLFESFLSGMVTVSLFSMYMTVSWPVVAGTQFTAYMAILNFSTTLGHWLAGAFDAFDIITVFIAFGIFQIVIVAILPFIDIHQTRRVLGEGH